VGTPEQVAERIDEFEAAGIDLLLLQFSPQLEEMERFAETVIRPSQKLPASTSALDVRDAAQRKDALATGS
jgi:FMNH2-dependent dimethyl sulfone monooxygenase